MRRMVAPLLGLALVVAACSSKGGTSSTPTARRTLVVFAASSLTKSFTKIGADFEAANAGVRVSFDFGASSDLATQIESEGAADVFASASGAWMDEVATKTGVTDRVNFATNDLVIITPASNPAAVWIPPGVVHAYRNVGDVSGLVFNAPNRLYAGWGKKEPVDEIRHEDAEPGIFPMD